MQTEISTPRLGDVQVNATDYAGEIVVERFGYFNFNDEPGWSVPAWEEQGCPDLAGPFANVEQAQAALRNDQPV